MFKLIQRGQIFADRHGWPVIIEGVRNDVVRYRRNGRIGYASIYRLNNDFEPLDHREAEQIRAELEASEHIKKLRSMRRDRNTQRSTEGKLACTVSRPETQQCMG